MTISAPELELMLFETSRDGARNAQLHGINAFLVDWEYVGKTSRQKDFDTEVNAHGVADVQAVAALAEAKVWCRINRDGDLQEIESALTAGAKGIFLPMVTHVQEVEQFLRRIDGRCEAGILVETVAALNCARDIASFPLDRVYFGLNDFSISRGGGSIFRAILDGSVEQAREAFEHTVFGFGGATAVDAGYPLPSVRLIEEMARLKCQFTFLRRSYRRDIARIGPAALIEGVRAYWHHCLAKSNQEKAQDRRELEVQLWNICNVP